jgi:hypothetical protein
MATWSDVRRIALSLPDVTEGTWFGNVSWAVKRKTFAWERPLRKSDLEALGKKAPSGPILGVHTADLDMKDLMLASDPKVYFTTPHFDGYAAVLVRLDAISTKQLKGALVDAWLSRAPARIADAYLATAKRSKS